MAQARLLEKGAGWLAKRLQNRVPYHPSNTFLEGPFAPLPAEHTETALTVHGSIPPELNGMLTRIGPNPLHVENPATYHWFMGDGMVHGLRLQDGRALWYRNRYVGSDSANKALGKALATGPRRGIADVVNTNIIAHGGRLWALVEAGSYPVELDASLNTVKHGLFDSTLDNSFTAHPHLDPETGELHAICYDGLVHNRVQYLVVDKHSRVTRKIDIPVKHGPMMHDSAITKKHVVILDLPVTFSVKHALSGAPLPYAWNPRHQARVGLLPRNGESSDIRWFTIDPCFAFHICNAFDLEDGSVVVDLVVYERMFDRSRQGPEDQQNVAFERWTLAAGSSQVQRRVLSTERQEFPRFDERLTGKPYRHAYAVGVDNLGKPAANVLLHHDLHTGTTSKHHYGPQLITGEAVFVPRHADAAENEGWLLSYVHDLEGGNSRVVILDAADVAGKAVAEIELPVRVPLGFHGNWIATTE